jgi:CO/xanthine dehydrogenase Mo-binding subunit
MIPASLPQSLKTTPRLDRWVRFNADRTVTVFSGKVELGQGIETAIAQIAADELDVALDRLSLVAGDTTRSPDEWYTAGSQSIEIGGTSIRLACAEVRSLFLEAAAHELEVDVAELRVRDGTIEVAGRPRAEAAVVLGQARGVRRRRDPRDAGHRCGDGERELHRPLRRA